MRTLLWCALLATACGGPVDTTTDASSGSIDAGGADAAVADGGEDAGSSDAGAEDGGAVASPIAGAAHLVTVRTSAWDALNGTLRRYRRGASGWEPVGAEIPIVLGRSGLGWGRGLHGEGALPGLGGVDKREGDGRSPAGAFPLGTSLGYAAEPPSGATVPYVAMTPTLQCVEDVASTQYNRIVDRATTPVDWTGDDRLRRSDGLYEWLVFVEQNVEPAPVPGRGSCILLHVWTDTRSPTAGCTSMDRDALAQLIVDLAPADNVLVQLPEDAYAALRDPWGLP